MHRHGCQGWHLAQDVRDVRRAGPGGGDGSNPARKLPAGDGVPGVRRVRADVHAVRVVRRRRSRATQQAHLARVPAGVDSGSRLRVRGEGNAGRKGWSRRGSYFVAVKEDPDLKRFESINVSSTVTIPYTRAILGTTQKVRTVDGEVILRFPRGCSPARRCCQRSGGAQARATQRERRPVRDGEGDHPQAGVRGGEGTRREA